MGLNRSEFPLPTPRSRAGKELRGWMLWSVMPVAPVQVRAAFAQLSLLLVLCSAGRIYPSDQAGRAGQGVLFVPSFL